MKRPVPPKGFIYWGANLLQSLDRVGHKLRCDRVLNAGVMGLVKFYQRHISPHKGFSCAHRMLYGGPSCSEYFRRSLRTRGLSDTLPLFKRRLMECKQANYRLRAARKNQAFLPYQSNGRMATAIEGEERSPVDLDKKSNQPKKKRKRDNDSSPSAPHYVNDYDASWCTLCDAGDVCEGISICDSDCNGIPDCLEPGFNLMGACDGCACDCG